MRLFTIFLLISSVNFRYTIFSVSLTSFLLFVTCISCFNSCLTYKPYFLKNWQCFKNRYRLLLRNSTCRAVQVALNECSKKWRKIHEPCSVRLPFFRLSLDFRMQQCICHLIRSTLLEESS